MATDYFLERLKTEPLDYKLPCKDCRWLKESSIPSFRENYMECSFPVILPLYLYVSHEQQLRQKTKSEVWGPFADSAREIECKCFEVKDVKA